MENLNREELIKKAKQESELSDLKQHADKMIRGFENFNNNSPSRAIWELVQNACDLSNECEIILDYRNNGFSFSHNGKPFTTNSLISLIKQVSGKYGDQQDIPEVGKYGTGFLTTHTFGRKFKINSILKVDNSFFEIKDFLIDRSPKEWFALSSNIRDQKNNVYKILESGRIISTESFNTTLSYIPDTEQEHKYIQESKNDLEDYIPLVLTINNRLKKIVVINDNNIDEYVCIDKVCYNKLNTINLFKSIITRNGIEQVLFSLVDNESEIEIILPINKDLEVFEFNKKISKLFLYYPLIGSENFGINFIINCNNFLPTEPRDGIHLKSNKDQLKDQEVDNQKLIEKSSQMIFEFLNSNILEVKYPIYYANINFIRDSENTLLNEYFINLQNKWMDEIKNLDIVKSNDNFLKISETTFFDSELLKDEKTFDEIYNIASKYFPNLPIKDEIKLWSEYAKNWDSELVQFLNNEDIVSKITECKLSDFVDIELIKYYEYLINYDFSNLLIKYKLIPNIKGDFCYQSSLVINNNLNDILIEIGSVLIPESINKIVHKNFTFNNHFDKFGRKELSNNIKTKLDEINASLKIYKPDALEAKDSDLENYNSEKLIEFERIDSLLFENLLKYCKLSSNISSSSRPNNLIKLICKYYNIDDSLIYLESLPSNEENIDLRSTRKILIQIFFNLIQCHNNIWVENNIEFIKEILETNEDSYKDIFENSSIYPNQIFNLKKLIELKKDNDLHLEIIELYNTVLSTEIRRDLLLKTFNDFILTDTAINNKNLATEIEDVFFNTDINNISEHKFKYEILTIIKSLRDKKYHGLFPRLDDKKANIMLEVVTDEDTKDDIFSIVTLDNESLKKLGKLVQEDNFEKLLDKANEILSRENEDKANFQHKYEIGTYVENIIRNKLSAELNDRISIHFDNDYDIETKDIQGGQDIVIKFDDEIIYYVEVKSRWDSRSSVSMSKLQLQRSVENLNNYTLCVVDITKYEGNNDKYKLSVDEILELTNMVNNIGNMVMPLITENLKAEENISESVHLIDYRGIIPQSLFRSSVNFEDLVNKIQNIINDKLKKQFIDL